MYIFRQRKTLNFHILIFVVAVLVFRLFVVAVVAVSSRTNCKKREKIANWLCKRKLSANNDDISGWRCGWAPRRTAAPLHALLPTCALGKLHSGVHVCMCVCALAINWIGTHATTAALVNTFAASCIVAGAASAGADESIYCARRHFSCSQAQRLTVRFVNEIINVHLLIFFYCEFYFSFITATAATAA